MPEAIANVLIYARYIMLFGIVYFSWILERLWFERYDPFKAIFHLKIQGLTSVVVICLFVFSSLAIRRFWCRFLCPLGLFVGMIAKLSLLRIERNPDVCINCQVCNMVCPTLIKVSDCSKISDTCCIHCLECLKSCPANALELKFIKSSISTKPVAVVLTALIIFIGTLGIARINNSWDTNNLSSKVTYELRYPNEIKGWMKWSDVVTAFRADENKLIKELNLPPNFDRNMSIKALGEEFGLRMGNFRKAIERHRQR